MKGVRPIALAGCCADAMYGYGCCAFAMYGYGCCAFAGYVALALALAIYGYGDLPCA